MQYQSPSGAHGSVAEIATTQIVLPRQLCAMQHEPCGFLSHADSAADLPRGNAVLHGGNQPHDGKSLFERNGRVLRDLADLQRELLLRRWRTAAPLDRSPALRPAL